MAKQVMNVAFFAIILFVVAPSFMQASGNMPLIFYYVYIN